MAETSALETMLNYFQDKIQQLGSSAKAANDRNAQVIENVQAGLPAGQGISGALGDVLNVAPIAGMAKVFKPAQEMTLSDLVQKVAKNEVGMPNYQSLAPAYRNTLTGEIAQGSIGGSHSAVSEGLPLSWQKNMQHGYKYPDGPFLPDEWYSLLRDNKMTQTASNLLKKGISPDSIFEALRFASPSGR
jgi:hypothetical protein